MSSMDILKTIMTFTSYFQFNLCLLNVIGKEVLGIIKMVMNKIIEIDNE